jgi:Leucyl aminopeptidase (aminopeptidase T)
MLDERLVKLADLLVNYSTQVKEGDKVSIKAEDVALPFVIEVAKAAVKKGAFVDYSITVPEVEEAILKFGNEMQLSKPNNDYGMAVKESDVWITAWGSKNSRARSNISPELLQKRRMANSDERKIYVDRCASGALRWCGTQFPTNAEAQEAQMSLEEYEEFVYKAGMLDKENPIEEWKKVEANQERWIKYLDDKKELRIISKDTDIVIGIGGRKWMNCCGKENFPDGEIFTSPQENNINGIISFSYPAIYSGRMVEGVKLEVKDGKIIKATADSGEDFLKACLETDAGSKYFGEVAIGTNYNIKRFTRNILFDEKIGGTIHMAVGCGFPDAGGKNMSAIHWDMICAMQDGGKIFADGELFYENGKFIESVLK